MLQSAIVGAMPLLAPSLSLAQGRIPNDDVLPAPGMPAPKFVETNGIRMGYYEKGEGGIPVIFVHGFPEMAITWRGQLDAFSTVGFHAIAPDMRGYGITGGPAESRYYTMTHLTDDMIGLMDAKGIDQALFCGHDWGGAVVWSMARMHPDRCLGIIGVNSAASRPPHLPPVPSHSQRLAVPSDSYYARTFQEPGLAESVMERDVDHTIRWTFRHGGKAWDREIFASLPEDSMYRRWDYLAMLGSGELTGTLALPEDEFDYFVDTWSKTGFTGGLNWYRASGTGRRAANLKWEVDVPCLYIGAEDDTILEPLLADGMEDFIDDLEKYLIRDCGHWTQYEQPDELNALLISWMVRKFGHHA